MQDGDDVDDFTARSTVIAGETETVDFTGSNQFEGESSGSSYFLALHRPGSKQVILQPAPLYIVTRQVKALKIHQSLAPSTHQRVQARNALGETFGTKKAKAAIRANERNKVDAGAMESVAGVLQDRIDEGTENLPTQDEAKVAADAARLIPPYNAEAQTPEDAYPLLQIIPEQEWNALDGLVQQLKGAASDTDRYRMLPFVRSTWIRQHLRRAFSGPKPKNKDAKMLMCIAAMITFRGAVERSVPEKAKLLDRMSPIPEVLIDGLLARFTETARGSASAQMTTEKDTSLLTHTFALCLKTDNFATDTTLIASDLKMSLPRVNTLFRSLGCKIEALTPHDLKRLGLAESAAATKHATLKVPIAFPKPRAKRRA
ncbi:RNA polymerase I associated factor, A49-like protein [Auriscalpium vulgare]|uniref:RNA polymerase I associated factor, A49-like protein n=1 Tax=Auriscalpium vulgare TaxID=40419 RepID=A0ACB8S8G8_9AGAM|nr:RNA polymerase I associated factor, A49-like protein [Auriscalpium vulgare]